MDKLHEAKIEIVSPTFMEKRRTDEKEFIPKDQGMRKTDSIDEKSTVDLVFDEAIKSEKLEIKKDYLKDIDKKQAVLKEKLKTLKDDREIEETKSIIERNNKLKERIEKNIQEQTEKNDDSEK
ncbi:MAG TPA: hypothetical protein VKA27_15810 [Sunxiuqinia sp.]|nr:hypothetical protein [Sunxiuqinia sp.]